MSTQGLYAWSKTAATNSNADSSINWAEGQAPSSVNDSARAMMARMAEFRDDTSGSLLTGGTSTAYTLATNEVFDSLAHLSGKSLKVRFHTTSGAAPLLNVDTLGLQALQTAQGTAVPTGAILGNSIWDVTYDNSIPAFLLEGVPAYAAVLPADVLKSDATAAISKGYTLTPNNAGTVSSGTFTPDPTQGNYQFYTNNGAHTLAAPASDCAIDILVTNSATAGAITFSGFTVGANTGEALTTTNGNKFILSIRRINAVATYLVKALQ
jgi:hypothetical protein